MRRGGADCGSRQDRLAFCRGVCASLLASEEVDHLLALLGPRHVPVVRPGDFDAAVRQDRTELLAELREPECVVVVHGFLHYVAVHVVRHAAATATASDTATATVYDGMNPDDHMRLRSRTGTAAHPTPLIRWPPPLCA